MLTATHLPHSAAATLKFSSPTYYPVLVIYAQKCTVLTNHAGILMLILKDGRSIMLIGMVLSKLYHKPDFQPSDVVQNIKQSHSWPKVAMSVGILCLICFHRFLMKIALVKCGTSV